MQHVGERIHACIITARKRSLGQGNIFTGICLSMVGGVLPDRDPPGQRPPLDRDPLDRDSLDRYSPRTETPGHRPPWTETPLYRDQRPPGQRPLWTENPRTETPRQRSLDRNPRTETPFTVKNARYASYWNAFLL